MSIHKTILCNKKQGRPALDVIKLNKTIAYQLNK